MPSLFADTISHVEVTFEDGAVVRLKKFIDAGVYEDVEAEQARLRVNPVDGNRELVMQNRDLLMIQKMLIHIKMPDGRIEAGPFDLPFIRGFDRGAFVILVDEVNRHNVPLSEVRMTRAMEILEIEQPGLMENLDLDQAEQDHLDDLEAA